MNILAHIFRLSLAIILSHQVATAQTTKTVFKNRLFEEGRTALSQSLGRDYTELCPQALMALETLKVHRDNSIDFQIYQGCISSSEFREALQRPQVIRHTVFIERYSEFVFKARINKVSKENMSEKLSLVNSMILTSLQKSFLVKGPRLEQREYSTLDQNAPIRSIEFGLKAMGAKGKLFIDSWVELPLYTISHPDKGDYNTQFIFAQTRLELRKNIGKDSGPEHIHAQTTLLSISEVDDVVTQTFSPLHNPVLLKIGTIDYKLAGDQEKRTSNLNIKILDLPVVSKVFMLRPDFGLATRFNTSLGMGLLRGDEAVSALRLEAEGELGVLNSKGAVLLHGHLTKEWADQGDLSEARFGLRGAFFLDGIFKELAGLPGARSSRLELDIQYLPEGSNNHPETTYPLGSFVFGAGLRTRF